jgi:hypothetical protein
VGLALHGDISLRRWATGATIGLLALTATVLLGLLGRSPARAVPGPVRFLYATGELVPIPAAIPHEEGDMVDRRIVPNLRWLAQRFPIYITDGYSGRLPSGEHVGCHGCHVKHSDHYNGLAVDIAPLRWSDRCDRNWRGITRLAMWAEPAQNRPRAPFRWVGYDGDAGHGCGHHLHLSWDHAPAPMFQLAEWVAVFPTGTSAPPPPPGQNASQPKAEPRLPQGPPGGVSTIRGGGISPRGD